MSMQPEKPHKILIVEDEGLIAHDIANRLETLGHKVIATCSTAEEAVAHAPEADLVLMDIRLDGHKDGIDAASEIREKFHVPVVFLTAHADRSTLERAKKTEPFGYIVKPLATASLQTSIEVALYKHRAERQLAEREAWLRTMFVSVVDAVIVAGADGRIVMLNRAAEVLTGWVQAVAIGQPAAKVVNLFDEGSGAQSADPIALAILRDAPVALTHSWKLISRSGRELMVEGAAVPAKAAGMNLGGVLTLRDVSARRWEERQLRQSQKLDAMGRLASGIANEYASLLAIIRNHSRQLVRDSGNDRAVRKLAEEILEAASTGEDMNRKLSALGSRQVSRQEPLSLNGLLRRAAKLIESAAGANVQVSMRLEPSAGKIKAEPAQMEQAVMQLVTHAVAAMTSGGRLLIETGSVDLPLDGNPTPHTLLAITHTGVEPDVERLFEPASVGEERFSLSLVHAIITEHGGYLSAQPTASRGCRFEVLLPSLEMRNVHTPAPMPYTPTVLFVDHREPVRAQLHNYFEANGYNLLEAEDAAEAVAIAQLHEGPIDLLIAGAAEADLIATQVKGIETLRVVDGPERGPGEIRRPFTQHVLLGRVETLLEKRRTAAAR